MLQKIIVVNKHTRDFDYTQFNYYSYAVALFIGWYTGLRISETLGLKKSNFSAIGKIAFAFFDFNLFVSCKSFFRTP